MTDPLVTDLERVKALAEAERDQSLRFRTYLKGYLNWSDERLDDLVRQVSEDVAAQIDCTRCAACCRTMVCEVDDRDIERLSRALGIPAAECERRHIVSGDGQDKKLAGPPCPLLDGTRCSVYVGRPSACYSFPHLDRKGFRFRLLGVVANASECPIVFNTLQRLKQRFRFRERRR